MPETIYGRLTTGLAAMLLPRTVAQKLGLVSIGGGRGLWWFVEFDTLLTDILLILVGIVFFRSLRRGGWREPMLWYLVAITVGIALALAYTVSNFGTLFRHREMLVATAVLLAIVSTRLSYNPRPAA